MFLSVFICLPFSLSPPLPSPAPLTPPLGSRLPRRFPVGIKGIKQIKKWERGTGEGGEGERTKEGVVGISVDGREREDWLRCCSGFHDFLSKISLYNILKKISPAVEQLRQQGRGEGGYGGERKERKSVVWAILLCMRRRDGGMIIITKAKWMFQVRSGRSRRNSQINQCTFNCIRGARYGVEREVLLHSLSLRCVAMR